MFVSAQPMRGGIVLEGFEEILSRHSKFFSVRGKGKHPMEPELIFDDSD